MDFELSEDEVALADSVRTLCAGRFPVERLLALATTAADGGARTGLDMDGWSALASSGVFALQVPEESGGVGLGMGAATVVFEELGRALVPGPLVATHLAARLGVPVLNGAADGKAVVGSIAPALRNGDGSIIPQLVSDLDALSALVLVEEDGLAVIDASSVEAFEVRRSLDPLTPMWRVQRIPPGERVAGTDEARRWWRDESVLVGAFLVGIAAKCVDLAVAYAKEREQFGKPIGSFQAIKHICADMLVRAETARVAVQAAGVTIDEPEVGDPQRAAAGCALLAAEAALLNAKACIQVHGGMGFTWEVPAHLYLMRAKVLALSLESAGALAELVADLYRDDLEGQ